MRGRLDRSLRLNDLGCRDRDRRLFSCRRGGLSIRNRQDSCESSGHVGSEVDIGPETPSITGTAQAVSIIAWDSTRPSLWPIWPNAPSEWFV